MLSNPLPDSYYPLIDGVSIFQSNKDKFNLMAKKWFFFLVFIVLLGQRNMLIEKKKIIIKKIFKILNLNIYWLKKKNIHQKVLFI